MSNLRKLIKNKSIQLFVGLAILIGCVVVLTNGTAFVKEHSLAILIVFMVVIAAIDAAYKGEADCE